MKRKALILTSTTAAVLIGLGALGATASWAHGQGGYGQGMGQGMGPGMMQDGQGYGQDHGMGPGMMHGHGQGYGMGPGMMQGEGREDCPYGKGAELEKPLTADDVRANFEKQLEWRGNKRLKVGNVTEQDDKTIIAEITTQDGSLVEKYAIERATGKWRAVTE